VNEALSRKTLALAAQTEHELNVVPDANHQHADTQKYKSFTKFPRGMPAPRKQVRFPQVAEELKDCESEADQ
jgi:hypothetical protein